MPYYLNAHIRHLVTQDLTLCCYELFRFLVPLRIEIEIIYELVYTMQYCIQYKNDAIQYI